MGFVSTLGRFDFGSSVQLTPGLALCSVIQNLEP